MKPAELIWRLRLETEASRGAETVGRLAGIHIASSSLSRVQGPSFCLVLWVQPHEAFALLGSSLYCTAPYRYSHNDKARLDCNIVGPARRNLSFVRADIHGLVVQQTGG